VIVFLSGPTDSFLCIPSPLLTYGARDKERDCNKEKNRTMKRVGMGQVREGREEREERTGGDGMNGE